MVPFENVSKNVLTAHIRTIGIAGTLAIDSVSNMLWVLLAERVSTCFCGVFFPPAFASSHRIASRYYYYIIYVQYPHFDVFSSPILTNHQLLL